MLHLTGDLYAHYTRVPSKSVKNKNIHQINTNGDLSHLYISDFVCWDKDVTIEDEEGKKRYFPALKTEITETGLRCQSLDDYMTDKVKDYFKKHDWPKYPDNRSFYPERYNDGVTIHSRYPARYFHAFFAHHRRTEYENPGQWARNMTDRAYFHSVHLWRVH